MKRIMLIGYAILIHLLAGVLLVRFFANWVRGGGGAFRLEQVTDGNTPGSWSQGLRDAYGEHVQGASFARLLDNRGNTLAIAVAFQDYGLNSLHVALPGSSTSWSWTNPPKWRMVAAQALDPVVVSDPFGDELRGVGTRSVADDDGDGVPEWMRVRESPEVPLQTYRLVDDPWVPAED